MEEEIFFNFVLGEGRRKVGGREYTGQEQQTKKGEEKRKGIMKKRMEKS